MSNPTFKKGNEVATIDVEMVTVTDSDNHTYGLVTSNKVEVNAVTETNDAVKLIVKGKLISQKGQKVTVTGNTIVLTDNVFNAQLVQLLQGGTIVFSKKYSSASTEFAADSTRYITVGTGADTEYLSFTFASAVTGIIEYNDATGVLELVVSSTRTRKSYTVTTSAPASPATSLSVTSATDETHVKSYTPPVIGDDVQSEVFTLSCYSAIYNAAGLRMGYEKISYPNCRGVPVAFSNEDDVFRAPEYTINSMPDNGEAPYVIEYVPRLPVESNS